MVDVVRLSVGQDHQQPLARALLVKLVRDVPNRGAHTGVVARLEAGDAAATAGENLSSNRLMVSTRIQSLRRDVNVWTENLSPQASRPRESTSRACISTSSTLRLSTQESVDSDTSTSIVVASSCAGRPGAFEYVVVRLAGDEKIDTRADDGVHVDIVSIQLCVSNFALRAQVFEVLLDLADDGLIYRQSRVLGVGSNTRYDAAMILQVFVLAKIPFGIDKFALDAGRVDRLGTEVEIEMKLGLRPFLRLAQRDVIELVSADGSSSSRSSVGRSTLTISAIARIFSNLFKIKGSRLRSSPSFCRFASCESLSSRSRCAASERRSSRSDDWISVRPRKSGQRGMESIGR